MKWEWDSHWVGRFSIEVKGFFWWRSARRLYEGGNTTAKIAQILEWPGWLVRLIVRPTPEQDAIADWYDRGRMASEPPPPGVQVRR